MERKISDIYDEYKIMPQLREHMFRVAAVAILICNNFDENLLKENITEACLLHDMGNIVKFQLGVFFTEFLEPQGLHYWETIQEEFIKKYGEDDHLATFKIVEELGITGKTFDFLESITSKLGKTREPTLDFNVQICKYADFRVSPRGVLSLRERINEWVNRDPRISQEYAENTFNIFSNIEQQIFAKCKIKPEDINDEAIKAVVSELKEFVVK